MVRKVLLLAPTINPCSTGESRWNFEWVEQLSKRFDVTLLAARWAHHTHLLNTLLPKATVVEWDAHSAYTRLGHFNHMAKPYYIQYFFWARSWIKLNFWRYKFDIIHQMLPLAMRYPCPAVDLGLPYIIGPLAGSLPTPPAMRIEQENSKWYMQLRNVDQLRLRMDPWLRASYTQAKFLIVPSAYYVEYLNKYLRLDNIEVVNVMGVSCLPQNNSVNIMSDLTDRVRLLFVGRAVRTKGLRDLICALRYLKHINKIHLDVIGYGPDTPKCQREVEHLGLTSRVTFHGYLPREKVEAHYREADIFVFPSFREALGNVLFEAMSYGIPIVGCDYAGPGQIIDNQCGIRITPARSELYSQKIAEAIDQLIDNPIQAKRMGAHGRKKIERFLNWSGFIDEICAVYERSAQRP